MGQLQVFQHLHHRGTRRRSEREEIGNLFEKIMKENFPNLLKEIDMQVQEAQRVPNKMGTKGSTPQHTMIKCQRLKKTNIKSSKRNAVSFLQRSSHKTVS